MGDKIPQIVGSVLWRSPFREQPPSGGRLLGGGGMVGGNPHNWW